MRAAIQRGLQLCAVAVIHAAGTACRAPATANQMSRRAASDTGNLFEEGVGEVDYVKVNAGIIVFAMGVGDVFVFIA